ncbi:hypothetical protein SAMN05442782_2583 [Streptomyces sp. OK228]|nr:hypothetical protein SAMN05442782_2583 [Streptomyces sp. OK228]
MRGRDEVHRIADLGDRLRTPLPYGTHARPPHHRPRHRRTRVGEPGSVPLGAEDGLQQIHDGEVGEPGHGEVGQLLGRLHDVQGAAHTGAGFIDHGNQLAGVPAVGDVQHHVADVRDGALDVHQGEERRGVGVLPMRIGPAPAQVLEVADRLAAPQYLAHHVLEGLRMEAREEVGQAPAQTLLTRYAADALQGVVDPGAAQVHVHDGHSHGRAGQEPVQHGLPHGPARDALPCREEKTLVVADLERRGNPQIHLDTTAVAMGQRDLSAPGLALTTAFHDRRYTAGVFGHGEQTADGASDDLAGRTTEEFFRASGPADHRAGQGDDRRRVRGCFFHTDIGLCAGTFARFRNRRCHVFTAIPIPPCSRLPQRRASGARDRSTR